MTDVRTEAATDRNYSSTCTISDIIVLSHLTLELVLRLSQQLRANRILNNNPELRDPERVRSSRVATKICPVIRDLGNGARCDVSHNYSHTGSRIRPFDWYRTW